MSGQPHNPGARQVLGAGVVLGGGVAGKKIVWNGGAWECDDLGIRLKRFVGGRAEPVDFVPKSLRIADDLGWLVPGEPVKEGDAWRVPLTIREGAVVAPPSSGGQVVFSAAAPGEVRPEPPQRPVQVKLTVSVEIDMSGIATAAAAAGMIPGGAAVVAAGLPPVALTSSIVYRVVPPTVVWSVEQERAVPLAGAGDLVGIGYSDVAAADLGLAVGGAADVRLVSNELPPGWFGGAAVSCGVTRKSAALGVTVSSVTPQPASENSASAALRMTTTRLVLHPVAEIVHEDVANAAVGLQIVTRAPHLGTQVQTVACEAQALDVCLYFKDTPAARFVWSPQTRLRVRASAAAEKPPVRSRTKLDLRFLKGWSAPRVHYRRPEDELDDSILAPDVPTTEYWAPSRDVWKKNGMPTRRLLTCAIGGDETVPVPQHDGEDLFYALALEADVELQPVRKAHVRIRIGPSDLVADASPGHGLDLDDPAVLDAILRTFDVYFDAIE